ncbi:hypothetical protein FOZ63_017865, partial [Perkinsus olseni]
EEDPLPMPMPPPLPVMPLPPSGSPAGGLNTPYIANSQDGVLRTAIQLSCPEGGSDVPSSVAEAFKQLLERLAALEKENNHMAQLLSVTQTSTASAADGKKEVKPLPLDSAGGYDPEAAEQMDSEDEEEAALERLGLTSSPPPPSTSSQGVKRSSEAVVDLEESSAKRPPWRVGGALSGGGASPTQRSNTDV